MSALRRFLRDETGAGAAEFALVTPLLLLMIFGIIDAARAMYFMNEAEKAVQMGVRYAVVADMVPTSLYNHNFALSNGIPGGNVVPTSAFSETVCTTTSCSGGWTYNAAAFDRIVNRMRVFLPDITDTNVTVTYTNVGLGFAGDPNGPDVSPLVTISLSGMQFRSLLLFGQNLTMPSFRSALTLEDGAGTIAN